MRKFNRTEAKKGNWDPLMDVAKAREILNIYTLEHGRDMAPDELDAHRMGVEALLEGGAAGMGGDDNGDERGGKE